MVERSVTGCSITQPKTGLIYKVTTADMFKRLVYPILSLCFVFLVVSCQSAPLAGPGPRVSVQSGPAVGLAVDAIDGSLLKAGSGVFRSTDHGQSWQPLPIPP